MSEDQPPTLHKWDYTNPVSGAPRYGVRYWHEESGQWVGIIPQFQKPYFTTPEARDAFLAKLLKNRRKRFIADNRLN